jgi:hypothetical protein
MLPKGQCVPGGHIIGHALPCRQKYPGEQIPTDAEEFVAFIDMLVRPNAPQNMPAINLIAHQPVRKLLNIPIQNPQNTASRHHAPAGHATTADIPLDGQYDPGGHVSGADDAIGQYVPAKHMPVELDVWPTPLQ